MRCSAAIAIASFRAVTMSFTNCHHVNEWKHGGLTDLANLALLLCTTTA